MLQSLQKLFMRVVDRVENNPTPFPAYYFLFFAILAVRLALEFFSSHRLFRAEDITHIGLWFVFIVMAFMLQLQLFSGEKMIKVAKLVITFFSIALTAPLIDLLVSGGQGAKMNYLSLNSLQDVLWAYVTVGGSSFSRGATLGIRVEIVLLLIASFNYVRTKTGSWLWALLGAWCIYTVLFLSGAVPRILGFIVDAFSLEYGPDDQSTLLFLLCLNLPLIFLAFWRHRPELIHKILGASAWGAVGLALLHVVIGAMLARKLYPENWVLNPTTLFWFPLLLAQCLSFVALLGLHRLRIAGKSEWEGSFRLEKGLLLFLLVIGALISVRNLFAVGVLWSLLFLLYSPPLLLARVPLLRTLMQAMALLAGALIGFGTFGAPMVGFPSEWIAVLLIPAVILGMFADFSPNQASVIPWIEALDARWRKVLSRALALALPGAGLVVAMLLDCDPGLKWAVPLALLLPAAIMWLRPSHTQWVLLALTPAYFLLTIAAFC